MSTFNRYRSIYSHEELMERLRNLRHVALDMDGTIYLDNDLFDGTLDFLEYVKKIGGRYIFLTNNSSKSVNKYIEKLASLGIKTTAEDFLTSTDATVLYLKKKSYNKIYNNQQKYFIEKRQVLQLIGN